MKPTMTPADLDRHRTGLRALVDERILPLVDEAERTQRFPTEILPWLAEAGVLGLGAPAVDGGGGGGRTAECMAVEELTRAAAGIAMSVIPFFILRMAIWEFGDRSVIDEVGIPLSEGARIGGIALSEPGAGSDASAVRTRAERVAGGWRLSGQKMFITNGTIATDLMVVARTGTGPGTADMGLFLLDATGPGIETHKLDKECARSSDTAAVFLDGAFVPDHRVLGAASGGFHRAMRVLNGERLMSVARALSLAASSVDLVRSLLESQERDGVAATAFQSFQAPYADALTSIWMMRTAFDTVTRRWDDGEDLVAEIAMLKAACPQRAAEICDWAQGAAGPAGAIAGGTLARNARDARLGPVGAGSTQVQHRILARWSGLPRAAE